MMGIERKVRRYDHFVKIKRKIPNSVLFREISNNSQKFIQNVHHSVDELGYLLMCLYPLLNFDEFLAIAYGIREERENHKVEEIKKYRDDLLSGLENFVTANGGIVIGGSIKDIKIPSKKKIDRYYYIWVSDTSEEFKDKVDSLNLYELLSYFLKKGMGYVKSNERNLERSKKIYNELNPYSSIPNQIDSFKERINLFSLIFPEFEEEFKEAIKEFPLTYCFYGQYNNIKAKRGGDNSKLRVMEFMPAYPKNKEEHIIQYSRHLSGMMKYFPDFYIDQTKIGEYINKPSLYRPEQLSIF